MSRLTEQIEGPRACGPYEVAATLDLLNQVFFPDEPRMGHYLPHVATEENREQMRIIKVNGRVVAHVGAYVSEIATGRGTLRLGGIWSVCCHPDYRRRGLGEQCMRDAMARMQELGCDLGWLGTGIDAWYRRFGWEYAGRAYTFELNRGNVGLLPELDDAQVSERPWPDLEQMLTRHMQDGLGCLRRPEVFAALLGRPDLACYTAARGDELVAYALVYGGNLIEQAGPPPVTAGLIREVFRRRDDTSRPTSTSSRPGRMEVQTPASDKGLAGLLSSLRLPYHYGDRGMMWVTNLESLLEKLGLAGEIAFQETAPGVTLRRGSEQVELTRQELVKLLFGPEEVADFAEDLFPLEFYHWPLDTV